MTLRAKITTVEQALAFGFDEEGIGISGRVVEGYGVILNSPMMKVAFPEEI